MTLGKKVCCGFLFTTLLMLPPVAAVSNQSLWIDEAITAYFAVHSRLLHLDQFRQVSGITNMPLYHILLTAWVTFFGDTERCLRYSNLPPALLFLSSIAFLCRHSRAPYKFIIPFLFSVFPLLSYYVNDVRPYTALLGLSAGATVAFLTFVERPTRLAAWLCVAFSLFSIAMHLFGALCPFTLLSFTGISARARRVVYAEWRSWVAPLATATVLLVFMLGFYLNGPGIASKASFATASPDTPINSPTTWRNIVFVLYEALGFAGLGPPRNQMRLHLTRGTFIPYVAYLTVGIVALLIFSVYVLRTPGSPERQDARDLLIASGTSLLLLALASRLMHFGFVGRHVMSLIGISCCSVALFLLSNETVLRSLACAAMLMSWTMSSVRIGIVYPYGKDDSRTALQIARNAHLPILWNDNPGDPAPGYYSAGDESDTDFSWFTPSPLRSPEHWHLVIKFRRLQAGSQEFVEQQVRSLLPGDYIVVMGKPDQADPRGLWAHQLARWQPRLLNRLNGFDVFLVRVPLQ